MKVSIIIPVLNEAKLIHRQLQALQCYREQGHEIIVVDGGSSDGGPELAANLVTVSCSTAAGRSRQMNHGADFATGQILLFLHVDTVLPADSMLLIESALQRKESEWGRFDVKLAGSGLVFKLISTMMNLRSALTGVCTGDQALFCRRQSFEELGGFAAMPLMEDVEISKRLRTRAWPVRIRLPVVTSSRRWEQNGIVKTIALMWLLRLRYFLGTDPRKLAEIYYPKSVTVPQEKIE